MKRLLLITTLFLSLVNFAQDGNLDTTFNIGTGLDGSIYSSAIQTDGKIIIGGDFTTYNGVSVNRIIRLNIDGSKDNTFQNGTGPTYIVSSINILQSGKIIITGNFSSYNGTSSPCIARLNQNGTLDTTFNVGGSGGNGAITNCSIQSDGKMIIGGLFTAYNGHTSKNIARINADGSFDNTFTVGLGANDTINTSSIQNDGKIIIGGYFTTYNGVTVNHIIRLNTNGTIDTSFNSTGANGIINSIAVQPDQKILVGGNFTTFNGVTSNRITRLNSNGTIDSSFLGLGADASIFDIKIQPNNKILICGGFNNYNSTTSNTIARLNTDGTLDSTFNSGLGGNNGISIMCLQTDGKVIIGGNFGTYNGILSIRIARLNNSFLNNISFINDNKSYIYPNPTNKSFQIKSQETIVKIELYNELGCKIKENDNTAEEINIEGISKGIYFVKLINIENESKIFKLIIEK